MSAATAGLLAASPATIVAPNGQIQPIDLMLLNTGSSEETVAITISNDGATTRAIQGCVLLEDEGAVYARIWIGPNDTLTASSTNADVVTWRAQPSAALGFSLTTFAADGSIKTSSTSVSTGNEHILGNLEVDGTSTLTGAVAAGATLTTVGNTTIGGIARAAVLAVTGTSTLSGNVTGGGVGAFAGNVTSGAAILSAGNITGGGVGAFAGNIAGGAAITSVGNATVGGIAAAAIAAISGTSTFSGAVTAGSTASFAGVTTHGGAAIMGAALCLKPNPVAAAGTNQGNAAALVTGHNNVSGANGTTGVRLPTFTTSGSEIVSINNAADAVLNVYPTTGGTINNDNGAFTLGARAGAIVISSAADACTDVSGNLTAVP